MANRTVCCIVANADKAAAQTIAMAHGDGPGTFSVPLSTSSGITNPALATHWGMEGQIPEEEVNAFEISVDPMINVTDTNGAGFNSIIGSREPRLYKIIEPI